MGCSVWGFDPKPLRQSHEPSKDIVKALIRTRVVRKSHKPSKDLVKALLSVGRFETGQVKGLAALMKGKAGGVLRMLNLKTLKPQNPTKKKRP